VASCRQLADDETARSYIIMTRCSDPELHRSRIERSATRIERRRREIPNWYEFDWGHVEEAMANWEELDDVDLVLDTVCPLEDNVALLKAVLPA